MNLTEYTYLKRTGFKIVDTDDKSGFWFRKEYSHPVINKLAIEVDPFNMNLSVWCEEAEGHGFEYHSAIILYECKFSVDELVAIKKQLGI